MFKQLLPKLLPYQSFRAFGFPRLLPLNLTLGLTYSCNSRCRTCRVYEKKAEDLSLAEWEKTFLSLSKTPYWFTLSGGEPFLRKDLAQICRSAYQNCRPGIINIPTNGLLFEQIPPRVKEIARDCPNASVIINLSLDGIEKDNDRIRGVAGAYEKALKTYSALKELKPALPNLTLGIHTVISQFNVENFPLIYRELIKLEPDSYITEIAEERIELGTVGIEITPTADAYAKAIDFLISQLQKLKLKGISRLTRAFRLRYYRMVKQVLVEKRQVFPCYAGFASAQIAPDGEVWFCCIKGVSIGNLREVDYNFARLWFSQKAEALRKQVKKGECFCPMANASYTNMLFSFPILFKVAGDFLSG